MIALLVGLALAAPPEESATLDLLGGGTEEGVAVHVQAGFSWMGVRGTAPLGPLTAIVEVDSALFNRFQPGVGVGKRLISGERGRVSVEGLLGWQLQYGALAQRGPSAVFRLRNALRLGRVVPALTLGSRHTLRQDRTVLETAEGDEVTWERAHLWSPFVAPAVGVVFGPNLGLDAGLDFHFVDRGRTAVAIPGLHLALHVGGGK